ncbi:MAG TPA: trigger factor [Longimicrobium sp.]|nr:trigger factor [Longimicrobium sp.]
MAAENTSTDLQVSVHETDRSWARKLTVTVPRERVAKTRRSVASQIARNMRVPGFRKGKLPESLVEKQFGPAIDQETLDRLIQESYREALDREGLQPIAQGQVENVHYEKGADLVFDVSLEVQPQVDLARTEGFVVARPADTVGEDEVEALLERLRNDRATLHPVTDRKPDYGDVVMVEITDLTPPAEGEEEPAAREPQPYRFALGEQQAIPAIEEAIMALDPETEDEFDITFPEEFPDPEQAGKTQRLRIRLTEVRRREFPALDDDFARGLGDFEGIDALRARVRGDLEGESKRRADQAVRDALVAQILEANPLEVPDSMVDRYLDFMTGQVDAEGKRRGGERTPEQEEQFSQFREMMRPQAESALKRMLVIEHLADREGLRATHDDVDARVEQLAQEHGRQPGEIWLELERSGQLQALEHEITEERVFAWLAERNTVG